MVFSMAQSRKHRRQPYRSRVSWIDRDFHAFCVIIYVVICLFDFLLFPLYFEYSNAKFTPDHQAQIAESFKDGSSQVQVFVALRQERTWHPITLESSGLFHVAFGAILGVGIWARGKGTSVMSDSTESLQTMITNGGVQPSGATMTVTTGTTTTRQPSITHPTS